MGQNYYADYEEVKDNQVDTAGHLWGLVYARMVSPPGAAQAVVRKDFQFIYVVSAVLPAITDGQHREACATQTKLTLSIRAK